MKKLKLIGSLLKNTLYFCHGIPILSVCQKIHVFFDSVAGFFLPRSVGCYGTPRGLTEPHSKNVTFKSYLTYTLECTSVGVFLTCIGTYQAVLSNSAWKKGKNEQIKKFLKNGLLYMSSMG